MTTQHNAVPRPSYTHPSNGPTANNAASVTDLNTTLDAFLANSTTHAGAALPRGHHKPAPPTDHGVLNSPTDLDAVGTLLERLTSEDIEKLLNFEGPLDLSAAPPLPDATFSGKDGDELLSLELPALQPPRQQRQRPLGNEQQQPSSTESMPTKTTNDPELERVADAARNVLAALGPRTTSAPPPSSPNESAATQPTASSPTKSLGAAPHRHVQQQQQQQRQSSVHHPQCMQPDQDYNAGGMRMPSNNPALYCVDPVTGQLVQVPGTGTDPAAMVSHPMSPQQQQQQWAGLQALTGHVLPGQHMPYVLPTNNMPHDMVGNNALSFFPGAAIPSSSLMYFPSEGQQQPTYLQPQQKSSPSKRRRSSRASIETAAQRIARVEQGYTYDPSTGRVYRHGPALLASTRDNKELPVVKSIFNAFEEHANFTGVPPADYVQRVSGAAASIPPLDSTHQYSQQLYQSGQQHPVHQDSHLNLNASASHPAGGSQGGAPSTSNNSHLLVPEASQGVVGGQYLQQTLQPSAAAASPGGRRINRGTGHGFITSLVTKELQSSTPPAADALGPAAEGASNGNKSNSGKQGSCRRLLGVSRDKWSLFWDAHIKPHGPYKAEDAAEENGPPQPQIEKQHVAGTGQVPLPPGNASHAMDMPATSSSPVVDAVKEAWLFLGKFPTQEQAGRAHDIAALKLFGDAAVTNFPRESYASTLSLLAQHSEAEVLAALRKDSQLAMQRTSKYKGVRRTGSGQYETRVEAEILRAGTVNPTSATSPGMPMAAMLS